MKHSHQESPIVDTQIISEKEKPQFTEVESNFIIKTLVERYGEKYSESFSGEPWLGDETWVKAYMRDFIQLILNEPNLVDVYHDEPERCIGLIEERLYKHTIH